MMLSFHMTNLFCKIQPTVLTIKLVIGSAGYTPCLPLDAFEASEGKIHSGKSKSKRRITFHHTEGNPHRDRLSTLCRVRCLNACVHSSAP